MAQNKGLQEFCYKYDITVLDDFKRAARYRYVSPLTLCADQSPPMGHDFASETLYTIAILESRLQQLIDIERIFFENAGDQGRMLFQKLMKQHYSEQELRNNNPALKEAYEAYTLLMGLCGHQKQIKL